MKRFRWFFLGYLMAHGLAWADPITQYQSVSCRYIYQNHGYLAIRKFHQGKEWYFLVVDTQTGRTQKVKAAIVQNSRLVKKDDTPYDRVLVSSHEGLTHVSKDTLALTVDLCPSSKPLDKSIFMDIPKKIPRPVPVGIALTGRWIVHHPTELEWLKNQEKTGQLRITWINHSDTHPYDPKAPISQTFLLTPGISIQEEVLNMEIKLLENGLTPSVFFRCPGLVSNGAVIQHIKALHLIPLGASAWLAKGEKIGSGSIILVHGNGNEPKGVELLLSWYQSTLGDGEWTALEDVLKNDSFRKDIP